MTRDDEIRWLKSFLYKDGKILTGRIKSIPDTLKDRIYHITHECRSSKISERLYWFINKLENYPKFCIFDNCNEPIVRFRGNQYYGTYCSKSCNRKALNSKNGNNFSGELGIQRRKIGMIKKYGVDHNMKVQSILDDRAQTYIEKYGAKTPAESPEIFSKIRQTNENSGWWLPIEQQDKFDRYKSLVRRITERQDISILENYNRRGHSRDELSYSLDHKFSVQEGFKINADPNIIGSIVNLEFIPNKINSRKKNKCSISYEILTDLYYKLGKKQ
jgi:hypothetical protein